ncbi:leishmanolysin-related zinc metalloendopeptidase [Algoriphagus vanfongensis]|uniref:leishmanolysin-related zinc metalloendopeptidase n=1 Tax=Algoriphagus vanfongensis TaxID=426371 RepID=UPI00040E68FA|nr:leishmanolysin-related zinc metalloendopeptidase [Algoriphagus vanfongensis]
MILSLKKICSGDTFLSPIQIKKVGFRILPSFVIIILFLISSCSQMEEQPDQAIAPKEQAETWTIPQATDEPQFITVTKSDQKLAEENARNGAGSAKNRFDISFVFLTPVTAEQQQIFTDAAARWERTIIKDLPEIPGPIPSALGQFFIVPEGEVVDDLIIEVVLAPIDGPGNILGAASPAYVRLSDNLPLSGYMFFDVEDLAVLDQFDLFEEVILHEMGHVLGIGTLWDFERDLNQGTIEDPYFVGKYAGIHWNAAGGSGLLPIENIGGPGTANSHWRETVLENELMTGFLNLGINPLSRITAGSLRDLGYGVAMVGEPYSVSEQVAARLNSQTGQGIDLAKGEILNRPIGYVEIE